MLPIENESSFNPSENKASLKDRFKQFAQDKKLTEKESADDTVVRQLGQYSARAAETYIGLPGNLQKAYKQTLEMIPNLLPEGAPSFQEATQGLKDPTEKGSFRDLLSNLPSSSELRETATKNISKKLGKDKEYLEPKNEKEKAVGDLVQDVTSFFMPGTGQLRMAVKLGAPIAGNLIKHGAKYLGADEETAEKAKLGVMLMSTLAGQSNPGQFASSRIGQAKQMIPDTATVNAGPLANSLTPLAERMQRGFGVPSKSRTVQGLEELSHQMQDGRINLRSLMEARDGINEWISEAGGWDIPTNTRDAALRNLNQLKTQIIRTVDQNMAQRFPEAGELYRTGYEAAAVNHQSNAISNFIERNFGKKTASVGAKLLFPALAGGAPFIPKTVAAAGIGYPFYKTGQVLYRVANSPTLARYYQDVIHTSSIGNAPAMIKSMEKFDKSMEKDEKKQNKGKKPTLEEFKLQFKNKG